MTEYAIVDNGEIVGFRYFDTVPNLPGKPYRQFLPVVETNPSFNPTTQVKTGPVVTLEATQVARVWSVRDKTAEEIDADKVSAVNALNGNTYTPNLKILLQLVNDVREVRSRVNALIDATGQVGTVTKFGAGQITQINMTQLKAAIKALL